MAVSTDQPCPECGHRPLRIAYRMAGRSATYGKASIRWHCKQCGKCGPVQFVIPDEAPLTGR